jgi:dipeptidyl aminopeptidase/acylaminoacyl peptidase
LTPEDLYHFRWIDQPRLDPAGRRVAYQVYRAVEESLDYRGFIEVRDLEGGQPPLQVTSGTQRDSAPEWAPDGRRLAFLRKRGARDQLFVVDLPGGEPRQLTTLVDGAAAHRWSASGQALAFLSPVLADPAAVVEDRRPPEEEDESRRPPVARVVTGFDYKHDGAGFSDGRYQHLHFVAAEGGEPRQVTSGAWAVEAFDWAPDGRRFVIVGDAEPDSDRRRELNLYVADLDGGLRVLVKGRYLSTPAWSPQGDLVAFVATEKNEAGVNEHVWVVPAEGGTPRCLTAGFERSAGDGLINDMRGGHGMRLVWSPDGTRIHFLASGPGVTGVFTADLDGNVAEVVGGRRHVFDFDAGAKHLVFCVGQPASPGDLFLAGGVEEQRLTDLNPWLRERSVFTPERLEFKARDGLSLEGWLLKPAVADGQRLPLVMQVHGGPHGQYGWTFFHEFQILAGLGFAVFYMNPRGSDGYGEEFKRAVVRDWAGEDYHDLMTSLDQLVERGFVDWERMGIAGGSYGGYMTNWAIGHTDRFRAAVAMRSICDLVSEYTQHDIVPWGMEELGPPPWSNLEELWNRSPIKYVQNIHTPLLLTHGEMDLRCAISQAEEMFGALHLLGREVQLVRFPGESHDLSRSGRPDRRVERLRRICGWFEKYLVGKAGAEAGKVASQVTATS